VIVVDNVVRDGAVVEPSLDDPHLQGIRRMIEEALGITNPS
jgi:predicted O-methyltransferase YrrM